LINVIYRDLLFMTLDKYAPFCVTQEEVPASQEFTTPTFADYFLEIPKQSQKSFPA